MLSVNGLVQLSHLYMVHSVQNLPLEGLEPRCIVYLIAWVAEVFDASYMRLMSTASASSASANHKDILKSWNGVPEGMTETSPNRLDPNGIPVIDFNRSTNNNDTSDRWLTSADYLIFKNINLSYNLPKA